MIFTNLDQITRRNLLERGLPIHYYLEELLHASSCIRELSFDSLYIVNTLSLPIGDYGEIDLPGDFVDDVCLCLGNGGMLRPIPKNDMINPLRFHDSTGDYVKPPNNSLYRDYGYQFGFGPNWSFYWNINDYGEATGRFFGARGASDRIGYKVIRERRQIQVTAACTGGEAVLMYISDGQRADNATQIDVEAFSTIQAWINWKRSPNADNPMSPEASSFNRAKRLLRARKDELTPVDVINIVRRSYTASIKS